MNDLTTQDQPPPAIAKANLTTGGALAALVPQDLDQAFRLSKALSLSGDMVPKHFQGKPEMIMAAIVRGMEIGLAPMQALSNIAVINGRASIWGDALPALIQRAGHDIDSGIDGEGDQMVAWAEVTRSSGKVYRRTFSVAEAKKAGLWGKQGPWQSYPTRMLQMRARSFAARDGAADALMGLQVAEEMQDVAPMRDVTPAPKGPNLAQRLAAPKPPVEDAPEDGEVMPPEPEAPAPDAHWTDAAPEDSFPGSPEFTQGANAAKDGIPASDCPYDQGTEAANDWLGGWHGQQKAAMQ
jgi:ribosome modulation factor